MPQDRFLEEIREVVALGIDVDDRGKGGIALLHYWASAGREDIVELLLTSDADINIQDDSGWTPLHFAAANGNLAMVRLLVGCGADVNGLATSSKQSWLDRLLGRRGKVTPRTAALNAGHAEVAQYLAEHKGQL